MSFAAYPSAGGGGGSFYSGQPIGSAPASANGANNFGSPSYPAASSFYTPSAPTAANTSAPYGSMYTPGYSNPNPTPSAPGYSSTGWSSYPASNSAQPPAGGGAMGSFSGTPNNYDAVAYGGGFPGGNSGLTDGIANADAVGGDDIQSRGLFHIRPAAFGIRPPMLGLGGFHGPRPFMHGPRLQMGHGFYKRFW
eukprot:TRINITY_DN2357_c0_g1_i1.p1 TRINITY_DN2357_c0_g1~~TRINITY_DN2357_c0_g1_i1.p1  ORF type:complete len:194 (+),score=16.94 TRINITY_DN2357_c0_g1_i1:92-673(+)